MQPVKIGDREKNCVDGSAQGEMVGSGQVGFERGQGQVARCVDMSGILFNRSSEEGGLCESHRRCQKLCLFEILRCCTVKRKNEEARAD